MTQELIERLHKIVGIIEEPEIVDIAAGTATYDATEREFILRYAKAAADALQSQSARIAELEGVLWREMDCAICGKWIGAHGKDEGHRPAVSTDKLDAAAARKGRA